MIAIASLFNPTESEITRDFWRQLESNCGLAGIKAAPYPHFSWMGAERINWPDSKNAIEEIASRSRKFFVQTTGLGLFTGERPILYIPIVKTERLIRLHRQIWKAAGQYLDDPNDYYRPDKWIPHITLAYGDLSETNLGCAASGMLSVPINFIIEIDNISVIYNSAEGAGVMGKFHLRH